MSVLLGPPTQAKAYKVLLQKQLEDRVFGTEKIGLLNFINNGLRLEHDQ
jgi:hypothetical protein